MARKNIKRINNSFLIFGNLWMLFLGPLPIMTITFFTLWRDCYNFNQYILSLIIASASLMISIANYIHPRNPFEGNWLITRSTFYTKEEEKALQFLMVSKEAKKLIIRTGLFLFILPFVLIFILHFLFPVEGNKYVKFEPILLNFLLYAISSNLFYSFIIESYIISHWNKIQEMKIELTDNYKKLSENFLKDISPSKDRSFLGEILSIDPNASFDLRLFFILIMIGGAVLLIIWGMGAWIILFDKISIQNFCLRIASFVVGAVLLNVSAKMWNKAQKKY